MIPLRDENPTRCLPILTAAILATNVAVFLYAVWLGNVGFDVLTARMGLIPFEITRGVDAISPTPFPFYLTLVTTMFMHGGWMHLGGNMLYLWIFGNNIEDTLGRVRFLASYLFWGLIATLAHVAASPDSTVPLVGASGAIAGVLGAYLATYPGARVHVLVFLIPFIRVVRMPALIVLGIWFLIQVLNAWLDAGTAGGGVAWYAHIFGFLAGYLQMRRRRQRLRKVYAM